MDNADTSSAPGALPPSSSPAHAHRLSRPARVCLIAWAVAVVAVFTLATRLEPDARGYGTHQQLGFPPCTFRFLWQIPCPACGGTTAFSQFVRGRWLAAASSNIGAFYLAVVFALSVPWCVLSAWQGQAWRVSDPLWTALLLMLTFVVLATGHWILRLM